MNQSTEIDWHARAKALQPDGRLYIEGRRLDAQSGETFEARSPIDGRLLAQVARGRAADIDAAVRSARAAFEDGRWSGRSPVERKRGLLRFADAIEAASEELALLEAVDIGKPISIALRADLAGTVNCLRWYAESIDKVYGEVAPTASNALALITREPVGVVGCIVPWNYPLLMAAWKLAPALATGNSVVLKPSEKSSLSTLRLAEIALEAGLPPGVLNVVTGFGHEAGEALALHDQVDAVGFTGSTRTGRRIMAYAAQSNLKHVYNELGGKSAALVFPECRDLAEAARALAGTLYHNAGQTCNAPSRILVHRDVAEAFAAELVIAANEWKPGHPLDAATRMGAIVDEGQLATIMGFVEEAQTSGARLRTGGTRVLTETGGTYLAPTVFDGVQHDQRLAREEIFGPVASILTFTDEAEAIRMANDSPYGLQASVWSTDVNRIHRVARAMRAGTVQVNQYDEDDMTVPFGGYKQSGNGRDKSLHAMEKYTELKTTWIRLHS